MSRFLQLHLLTFFPPANLNRDDTGRPKTAVVGGATRLRLSSQALKRAWRTSDVFKHALAGHMGQRTQRLGDDVRTHLLDRQVPPDRAKAVARSVAEVFGKLKDDKDPNPTRIEQLAFIGPEERQAAMALAERAAASGEVIVAKETGLLRTFDTAADIALFGRMLASDPAYNREAAAQVAHAITTHRVTIEDDYYTAVDDLKQPSEDAGAGFLGEAAFGSGVFYLYLCVDRALLMRNLGGDAAAQALAATALGALTEAAATTAPSGKQNSYAAHGRAQYVLAERGDAQPRTLVGAFSKPVTGSDLVEDSVAALATFRKALATAYGPAATEEKEMHVRADGAVTGSLAEIVAFARG
jgi:CRISPR system Cascade subunit CasC